MLLRIVAPHFVAGIIISNGLSVQAAPILSWTIGKHITFLRDYFQQKDWKVEKLSG